MDNYEVLEVIHASRTSETIILKVKEKNKRICDKVYALKLIGSLNNRFQKLIFKREVDALKTLNSCDNIVKIRDYMLNAEFRGKNDWGLILLDYVDGTNLEELDLSNFSQVEKYELCLKILKAIEEAHNYNVLHRDIKPSNIMYNIETGEVKIIDFGTSKIKSIVEQETTLPFYSPNFSAPEVVKGNSTTEASDIYSLGAVIFYILFGMLPNGTEMICRTLQDLEVPENLGILIAKMVAEEPENRFQEVGTVIDAFEEIIGDNSSQKDTYLCSIDVDKLRYLKNVSLIEANTNMTIFTKSFLKSQFKECSAFYNHNTDVYIFSGKKIAVECIYNEKDELFVVNRIMPLSVDRRISNQKRGFIIDGIVKFIESGRGNYSSRRLDNDNEKLIVQFRNSINSKSALQKQDELFEELFGKWQDGLDESMKNEKERVGRVVYSAFNIVDQQLILTVEEYKNNDIDGLENDMSYIIEDVDSRGNSFYFDIGTYHGINYEDDETLLIIDLDKKVQMGKVRPLLRKHRPVMEDFRANISAYKRQHYAIRALHDDNYSAKNLKDIENVYVKFVRIPIYIYVSSEGIDIDIMAVNKRNDPLLVLFKSEIIEQIRKKKVLKNIFVKYGLRKTFLGVDLEENENLKNDLQKYRKNKGDRDELEPIIEKEVLSDRKLSDEEFEVLLKYLADKCENCKINVYHLDDWAKSEWCSKVLSVLNGKKLSEIGYAECYDFRKALSIIQRTMPECSRDKVVQVKTEYYLSLVFDEKYIITGVPKDIVIMDSNTHIHKVEFYLQVM